MITAATKTRLRPRDEEDDRLLRLSEVAERMQVSEKTVRKLTLKKGLRYVRIGRELRFKREWVEDFIERVER
jgi:excisionase family DNA binding protein